MRPLGLVKLDEKKLKLKLEGASANVEEARANHQQAKSMHERNRPIYQSGVISEQSFLQNSDLMFIHRVAFSTVGMPRLEVYHGSYRI
jgi:multidrug resistance efflux pump